MAGDHNRFEVRKIVFARQGADDCVYEIVRSQLSIVGSHTAGSPTVAPTRPVHFVRLKRVATSGAIVGSKPGRDHDRVGKSVRQKRSRQAGAKIVVRIAALTMHNDQSSDELVV